MTRTLTRPLQLLLLIIGVIATAKSLWWVTERLTGKMLTLWDHR
jgi:hypothetical protein